MFRPKNAKASVLTLAIAATLFSALAGGAVAQQAETVRGRFPSISLAGPARHGQAAVDQLGSRLAAVAAWYGKSAAALRRELVTDHRMRVDSAGRLLAVEELEAPVQVTSAVATQTALQGGTLVGLDQTFQLHSRRGAARTIFLDFNGARIVNTVWNSSGMAINAQPFDFDGDQARFSAAELERIQFIWQRVAEDYAAFDVDVTTEQPAQDALTRSGTSDQVYGTTVVVTRTTGVYSCRCGGIAYVGVFNDPGATHAPDYYKPAFVFYDMLGGGAEKPVAEAISHEAGHNIGLHHDGDAQDSYYAGQGSDAKTGWAPIMGVGYYKPLVQFSKGEYSGASNTEDDFAVARSFGLPLRRDDFGNTIAAAARLQPVISAGTARISVRGVISSAADRDVFAVTGAAGPLTATVLPPTRSANADLMLVLRDAGGRILASANPLNDLGASLSFRLPAQGTYYLEVRGTGQGSAGATGYSSYGSVGNFSLTTSAVAPAGSAPTPVLAASVTSGMGPLSVTFDATKSTDDGRVAFWYWDFGDGSGDRTGSLSSVTHVYRKAGTYLARLTIFDNAGLSASTTRSITVTAAAAALAAPAATLAN